MKKYNLSKIMSRAWSIRRMNGRTECTMSTALRQAWAEAKRPALEIKGWFMSKNFTPNERLAIVGVDPVQIGETEKAVKLCWNTGYGKIVKWVPKSCFETEESREEELAAAVENRKARQAKYEELIAECRANGIPARKGWRVATMKDKLAALSA